MRKLTWPGLAAIAALVLAAPAGAKQMTLLQICGSSGCTALKPAVVMGHSSESLAIPVVQDYYVLRVGVGDGAKIFSRGEMYFAPDTGAVVIKGDDSQQGWTRLPSAAATRLRRAAHAIPAFAQPVVESVYVDYRRMAFPGAYLPLLGRLQRTAIPRTSESAVTISFSWGRSNPWSGSESLLSYLPKAKVIMRSDGVFRVPDAVADRIDRAMARR